MAFELPTERREPQMRMSDFTVLLYGDSGIGKTTFCSDLTDSTLVLDTEKGARLQNAYVAETSTWEEFVSFVTAFIKDNHPYNVVAIDTIGRLVLECTRYCVRKLGISHPSDAGFGKGYDVIKKTFDEQIHKLQMSPYGLWWISHASTRQIKSPRGDYDYTEPDLPGHISKLVIPLCDFIFYATLETKKITGEDKKMRIVNERVLYTKSSKNFKAKDRLRYSPLPEVLPLDSKKFMKLFMESLEKNQENSINV